MLLSDTCHQKVRKEYVLEKIKLFFDGKLKDVTKEAYKVAKERDLKIIGKELKSIYESLDHSRY